MVDNLLEIITERGSQKFYKPIDDLHLYWFRKLARMRVNLAGKKQGEHNSCQTKPSFSDDQSLGESQNII